MLTLRDIEQKRPYSTSIPEINSSLYIYWRFFQKKDSRRDNSWSKRTGAAMLVTLLHWCKNYASTNISGYLQNFYVCVQDNYGLIVKISTTANNKENQQTKENLCWSVKRNNFNLAIWLSFSVEGKATQTFVPNAFRMLPHSFSIYERAFAKYVAASDKVSPLVHVFSTPYFWLSSDNLFPNTDCTAYQLRSALLR